MRLVQLRPWIEASQDSNWATWMDPILIWDQSWTLFHPFCWILWIWSSIRGNWMGDQMSLSYSKIVVKITAFWLDGGKTCCFCLLKPFIWYSRSALKPGFFFVVVLLCGLLYFCFMAWKCLQLPPTRHKLSGRPTTYLHTHFYAQY